MKKKIVDLFLVISIFVFCGCGTHESNTYLRKSFFLMHMEFFINHLSDEFSISYGASLVILILIVRTLLLPLILFSSVKSMNQSIRMELLKTEIKYHRERINRSDTHIERQIEYKKMKDFNRKFGIKTFDILGLFPLFIQMPIISALFILINKDPQINNSFFFGFNLGERSFILAVIVLFVYIIQSIITIKSNGNSQNINNKFYLLSPIMIGCVSLTVPAALNIYWLLSGLFACIQTILMNYIVKPFITRSVKKNINMIIQEY